MQLQRTTQSGYVTLISVLIVGAIAISIGVSVVLLGIASGRTSLVAQQSYQAKALATTCAELALQELHTNSSYTGSDSFDLGIGDCVYTVINLGGENREVTATGNVGAIVRKIQVEIDGVVSTINIASWQEVADF